MILVLTAISFGGLGAAPALACGPEFEFIAARGSSEPPQGQGSGGDYSATSKDSPYGMGSVLSGVYSEFAALVGPERVKPYGVRFPAVAVAGGSDFVNGAGSLLHVGVLGNYTGSVRDGTTNVVAEITRAHAACADTRFVLGGYSQGAQAVADALQRMDPALGELVVAAAFFGDPYFNAESWASLASQSGRFGALGTRDEFPERLHGKVFSYCQPHDPICSLAKKHHILGDGNIFVRDYAWAYPRGLAPHFEYPIADGPDAARRLARAVGVTTPPAGNVPLDLVFAIDTTGSMTGTLSQVSANVQALASSIAATSTSYRFALVDYKDGPEQGDAYRAQIDLPFSTDVSAFSDAAARLSAAGGGDTPESVYSGIMTSLSLPWRPGVRKVVIVIGDAPGKDPEPTTGFTLAQVRDAALAVDPAQVYPVIVTPDQTVSDFMTPVADATGGRVTPAPDQATFVSALQTAIVQAGSAPVAEAGGPYAAVTGDAITLSAAGSRDESEDLTGFDWDYDGDGVFDQTTADPVVSHAYPAAGIYNLVVRVRAASGLAANATAQVVVTDPPAAPPGAPQRLVANAGDKQVTLRWAAGSAPLTEWFTITDRAGHVIDQVAAGADGAAPPAWIQSALTNGERYSFKVGAGNVVGQSPFAGPASAVPSDPKAPRITALSVRPRRIRTSAHARVRVRIRISKPATVGFRILRAVSGRRVGANCVTRSRGAATARRCTRYVISRSFKRSLPAGLRTTPLGRGARGADLGVGVYRLIATATSRSGHVGLPRTTSFVVRR